MKKCSKCEEPKPLVEFSAQPWGDGRRPDCKACRNTYSTARYHRLGTREMTARRYGISATDYAILLESQGGSCAVCGRQQSGRRALPVDHDHNTGRVRGILCPTCNGGLGMFRDDPALLKKASEYLIAYQEGEYDGS